MFDARPGDGPAARARDGGVGARTDFRARGPAPRMSTPECSRLRVAVDPGRLALVGEIDATTLPTLRTALRRAVADPGAPLVVDLRHVTYLSAAGVTEIIRAAAGGQLVVTVRPNSAVAHVLAVCGVDRVATVLDSIR